MQAQIYKKCPNGTYEFVMSTYSLDGHPLSKGMYLHLKNEIGGSIDFYCIEHIVLESIYATQKYKIYRRIENPPSFLTNDERQQITK